MKISAILLAIALATAPLFAGDWPAAFERYEAVALGKPARDEAHWQMWKYAGATGRLDELKQRWESHGSGEAGGSHQLLLALLAELESDFDSAHTHFDRAIEMAPSEAASWLLKGQMEAERRIPAARATLEKALELAGASELAGEAAEALAGDHVNSGRVDEARAVLDRATASAHDPQSWLRLTQKRAEAALPQGKLGELIAQIEAAPQGPMGGSEIAQAYLAIQDYAQAGAELERERKKRPQDPLLRLQALSIARTAKHTSELARLLREEAKVAPTQAIWRELFHTLVLNGAADEARKILAEQGAALFTEPGARTVRSAIPTVRTMEDGGRFSGPRAWRDLVPSLWQLDLARPAADALATAGNEGGWEAALLRAELLIAERDWPPAEEALWSILDTKWDAQPLAAGYEQWAAHPAAVQQIAAMPGAYLQDRIRRANWYLDGTPAPFNPKLTLSADRTTPVETLTDARDLALLYLAMIAAETQRAPDFLARLAHATAAWPRVERLMAFLIVQNPAGALGEMEAYAGEAREGRIDRFCRDQLAAIRRLPLESEQTERAAALMKRFPDAPPLGLESLASPDFGERFRQSNRAFRDGKFAEAWKIFEETSAAFRASGNPLAERETIACAMSFAFLLPELRGDAAQMAEAAALAVRSALPRPWSRRWPAVNDGIRAIVVTDTPAQVYRFFERGTGNPPRLDDVPAAMRARLVYPPSGLFSAEQTGALWTVFGQTRLTPEASAFGQKTGQDAPVWPLLKKQLDATAAELTRNELFLMRAAAAYLCWWNQEPAEAIARMKQLLTETGDPAIRLSLVTMLHMDGTSEAALATLAGMKPPAPAYARTIATWRLALLAQAHDTVAATALARELAAAPRETEDLRGLIALLNKAGCAEAAAILRPALQSRLSREEDFAKLPTALREMNSPANRTEAVALAKRTLLSASSAERSPRITMARNAALQTLDALGEREAYVAQLARESEAAPGNIEAWQRLAEASKDGDAAAAWRKVLELQPDHRLAARELLKAASDGGDEQRQLFEKLLAIEPDDVMEQHNDLLFTSYESAKQLPHLAEAISKAPFRTAGWRRGTGSGNTTTWRNLAERFIAKGRPIRAEAEREAALLVLRKALTTFDPVPSDLRQMMLQELVALNRAGEAGKELVECLAPGTGRLPLLFAWRTPSRTEEPRTTVDPSLLKMAQSLGIAPELRTRVEMAASRDATARVVWIFLRVAGREPSVLPDLLALIPQITSSGGDISWVLPLAADLAAWPEASDGCRRLLTAYDSAMAKMPRYSMTQRLEVARLLALAGGKDDAVRLARAALETARRSPSSFENRQAPRAVAKIALAAGDAELLTECTRLFMDFLTAQAKARSSINAADSLGFAGDLLDANRLTEAERILDALRNMSALQTNTQIALQMRPMEMEMKLRKGELRLASPVVWLDADRTTPEQATLVWDLGIVSRSGGSGPQPVIHGEAVSSLDGWLVVELFVGEDAESMQPVARIANGGSRGVWQGHLPMENGFARVVVSQGDRVLFGEAFQICAGRNLVGGADAGSFSPSLTGGDVKKVKGGPAIEGEFLSFHPFNSTGSNSNVAALAQRVPIKPGRDYLLGGWLRITGTRYARLGWRCVDREGKSVATGQFSTSNAGERFWTRCQQRLSWPRNDAEGQRIPANAAFIEPTIQGDGGFDVAGLYIIELPAPPPASAP